MIGTDENRAVLHVEVIAQHLMQGDLQENLDRL